MNRPTFILPIIAVAGLTASLPGALPAQTDTSPVLVDERVRVTTSSYPDQPTVGTLRSWDEESIELDTSASPGRIIPLPEVVRLEVSQGKRDNSVTGALVGGGIGLALGIATSIMVAVETPSGDSWIPDSFGAYAGITALSTLAGVGLGAAIGALTRTEEWEEVPLPGPARRGPEMMADG